MIGVLTQRDPAVDEPLESDLYGVGTLTHIHKMFRFPDGSLRLVVQGLQRFRIVQVTQYTPVPEGARRARSARWSPSEHEVEVRALAQSARQLLPARGRALPHALGRARDRWPANFLQRAGAARRPDRGQPAHAHDRAEAGVPRDARRARAARARQQGAGQGPRGARGRQQDPEPGQERAAEEPARVLPARADEGDPEGARRQRRPAARDLGAAREDRGRRDAGGGQEGGACASSSACRACRRPRPSTRSRAPTSTGWSRCPGASAARARSTWSRPRKSSTTTTTTSRRSRTASSSTWPCAR